VELGHLALRLVQSRRAGEGLRNRLALDFTGETKIRPMAAMAGLMERQLVLPQRPVMLVIEPRRKSPNPAISWTT